MSRGFLILAEGEKYLEMAYALALSIKLTQVQIKNVTLVTNDVVPEEYKHAFETIINIPWVSKKDDSRFKVDHRWKLYHVTPYEETIVLDADILFLDDISSMWNEFSKYDVYYTSKVLNYRGELINDNYYRKAFIYNNLPNLYSAVHYFKKRDFSKEFYSWVEIITNNWQLFYGKYVREYYPKEPSMDVTAALAAKILDCDKEITDSLRDPVTFVHMKPYVQGWKTVPESWQESVGIYYNNKCQLKIGNFKQSGIFHYTENNFMNKNIIRKLELAVCQMN